MSDPRFLQEGFDAQSSHVIEETGELMGRLGPLMAAIGKAKRWGLTSVNPLLPASIQETNFDWIFRELEGVQPELDDVTQAIGRLRKTMEGMRG